MELYVAVDIGCIECGEGSAVLGVFTTAEAANKVLEEHEERQAKNWSGQHSFEVFRVDGLDTVHRVEY